MEKKTIISASLSLFIHFLIIIIFCISIFYNDAFNLESKNIVQVEFVSFFQEQDAKQSSTNINNDDKIESENINDISDKSTAINQQNETTIVNENLEKVEVESQNQKEEIIHKEEEQKNNENQSSLAGKNEQKENNTIENKENKDNNGPDTEDNNIDERSIYKNKETNQNSSALLEMQGWIWDEVPRPNDTTDEVGKIVFEITVDAHGEIIKITTLERTVSLKVESIYKDSIIDITFSRTSENKKLIQGNSTGKVTFFIRYK